MDKMWWWNIRDDREGGKVKLIAGKLNNCPNVYYWELPNNIILIPKIGDYVVVENMNDYDLVKVVGIVETNEKYSKFITNCQMNKKVVCIVKREEIRED